MLVIKYPLGSQRRAFFVSDKGQVPVIFTPNVDLKDELKNTSIQITCLDEEGNVLKRVTSGDSGEVEDNEGSEGSENGENSANTENGENGQSSQGGSNTGGGDNGGGGDGGDGLTND